MYNHTPAVCFHGCYFLHSVFYNIDTFFFTAHPDPVDAVSCARRSYAWESGKSCHSGWRQHRHQSFSQFCTLPLFGVWHCAPPHLLSWHVKDGSSEFIWLIMTSWNATPTFAGLFDRFHNHLFKSVLIIYTNGSKKKKIKKKGEISHSNQKQAE